MSVHDFTAAAEAVANDLADVALPVIVLLPMPFLAYRWVRHFVGAGAKTTTVVSSSTSKAEALGMAHNTMYRHFKLYGIPTRGPRRRRSAT